MTSTLPIPMEISDSPPNPPPELKWVEDACHAAGVGFSPFFYLDMPAEVWRWLTRRVRMEERQGIRVAAGKRLGYLVEKALSSPQHHRPHVPSKWFIQGVPWYGGIHIELPADMAFHTRAWAARVEIEPRHLLVALAVHAYETRNGDAPPQQPFSLEMI